MPRPARPGPLRAWPAATQVLFRLVVAAAVTALVALTTRIGPTVWVIWRSAGIGVHVGDVVTLAVSSMWALVPVVRRHTSRRREPLPGRVGR